MNYKKLGFKCGIEVHQRLDTKKLFCNCSSSMQEEPEDEVVRKLRVVPGETGEMDPAALYEFLRDRKFIYKIYPSESCEVELDEEPPHQIREDALEISLQITKMLDCEVPDEIHPMRKTVIDGSNPSGFQRTMLVGMNGTLETSQGSVGIENVCLEEESAQILNREENTVIYGLNRLGIPLVEIGTAPDIKSPEHAKEVAKSLGNMLRATGKVQRGIGSIRQDVNVSIEGGSRIEVKGLQELDILEDTVRKEVERQKSLLGIKEKLNRRGASVPDDVFDVGQVFEGSDSKFYGKIMKDKDIKAFILKGFGGLLANKISGDKTFGKELSEYAEAHGLGGIIHTDEDIEKYDLLDEFGELKKKFDAGKDDVLVVAAGTKGLDEAIEAVKDRAKKAMEEIPEETRDSNDDGTTSYSRPLPGKARMYPETDVPAIRIGQKKLETIEIPESLEKKKKGLVEEGLSEHLAEEILDSRFYDLFRELRQSISMDLPTLANLLTIELKDLKKREGLDIEKIDSEKLTKIIKSIDEGKVPKDSFGKILEELLNKDKDLKDVLDKTEKIDDKSLAKIVKKVVDDKEELVGKDRAFKKLMGLVMQEVGGKAEGEKVSDILRKELDERK